MPSSQTRELARRLLASEAVAGSPSKSMLSAAVRVCEKLRQPVCVLAGVDGYRSLLSRALKLARAEAPSLNSVQVTNEGSLQDPGGIEQQVDHDDRGGDIFIAQLLGLFLTFLGAAVTLHLVQDAFPHVRVTTESDVPMAFETIQQEVQQLKNVSERLVSLAGQYPVVEEALMTISGNIRDTATLLDVFIRIRSTSNGTSKDTTGKQYKM